MFLFLPILLPFSDRLEKFFLSILWIWPQLLQGQSSDFLFLLQPPPPPPHPDKPLGRPNPKSLISVDFGSVSVRFGSVWLRLAPFRVRFGSVGWGRGGVGERGFCKGKEYH